MIINPTDFPILEFDSDPHAIMEPSKLVSPEDVPEHCVVCFFSEVIDELVQSGRARKIAVSRSEAGEHPLYEIGSERKRLAFFHPGIGAPHASALLEEMIARGCRKFIACGGCGVLDKQIAVDHLIIPQAAVRDEGTSYHYLPPSREVLANPIGIAAIEKVLNKHKIDYLISKTWTTDAYYRETAEKVRLRKSEGCLAVEMEAAAFFAVAQFRQVIFSLILYSGDLVLPESWDSRFWDKRGSIRQQLFWLAAEACLEL
jgi:uridine phosphorylase